mmetsp:Transcript_9778/g.14348  ORF Transcript_9778/g.14348 Transcript_9778/m.14348 type:complete len:877 (+) Transcript_9778:44-2674(+)
MGRQWRKRNRGGRKGGGRGGGKKGRDNRSSTFRFDDRFPTWQVNRRMEAYYAYQGLFNTYWKDDAAIVDCITDEEKTQESIRWMETIKRILPASFRIGADTPTVVRERLEKELDAMVGQEMEIKLDEERTITISPSKKIPFVPYAYQLSVDRHTIRRNPSLSALFEWLKVQTDAGFVSRQETVSMIPPIILDVESHHQVLDMCAAPGSKTGQIFEVVSQIPPGALEPVGCVVANDTDHKRAYMLTHQLKRIHSIAALVTSCEAQFFPLLFKKEQEGMFDRVLADVPCSGDGTMRKNPMVWRNWSSLNSYGLHSLQLSLAVNGARLTKVGGYLCYSTCAMNPIENEAVVAALLRMTDGALELVDRSDLPGLKARPGWTTWKVLREEKSRREVKNEQKKNNAKMQERREKFAQTQRRVWEDDTTGKEQEKDSKAEEKIDEDPNEKGEKEKEDQEEESRGRKAGAKTEELGPPPDWEPSTLKSRCEQEGFVEYTCFDDVEDKWKQTCRKSCFPPTPEEVESFQLEKCMRFLPQDMDTSGFFVTLLKKVKPLSSRARERAAKLAKEVIEVDKGSKDDNNKYTKSPPVKKTKLNPDDEAKKQSEDITTVSNSTEDAKSETNNAVSVEDKPKNDETKKDNAKAADLTRGGNENFVLASEDLLEPLMEYYGFNDAFPRDQCMARAKPTSKVIYFIGKAVKLFMDGGLQDKVTIINSGLKAFERNNNECEVRYRVNQEAIHYLVPYMTKRKIVVELSDFVNCLRHGAIKFEHFSTAFADQLRNLSVGSFVVILKGHEKDYAKKLMMVMWKCRGEHTNCLVNQVEKCGMKNKLQAFVGKDIVFVNDEKPSKKEADKDTENREDETTKTNDEMDETNDDEKDAASN